MLKKYKDSEIVKSLLDAGLDEQYILDGIEKGEIKVDIEKAAEKPEKEESDDKTKVEVEIETESEEDEDEMEKAYNMKKAELLEMEEKLSKVKGKKAKKDQPIEKAEESEDKIEKSMDDIEKSFGDKLDMIEKSIKEGFEASLSSIKEENELLKSEIESLRADVDKIGSVAPDFKAPNNLSFLEKGQKEFKDSEGKAIYHITKQREQIKDVLLKAYDGSEGEIKKSIADELSAYSSDTEANSIDEKVAKYLYDKENVRLVK